MVTIKFETDNAAFRDGDQLLDVWAVADVVKEIAKQIMDGYLKGDVRDLNGNIVGSYTVED
jgi:hypothetical protein